MRIIAGTYGSRKLFTLPGDNTRPSSDRLKTALFSKIGPYFDGGTGLDVFAGSGAVGLEGLSRGLDFVTFIEKEKSAVGIIKKNIQALGVTAQTNVLSGDARVVTQKMSQQFDFIFMDPPYAYENTLEIAQNLEKCVKIGGIMIIETDKKHSLPDTIGSLIKTDQRDYGVARLHTYEMR
ncbi:hypothetical protein AOC36_05485 [Erysipelothrix larvae]|uniref:16S rRNA (Guanine(966)-N(2))-methyltransferase RsmD n=1 Tax=Erysipelothrix larvae TaxID=1514105 RepID=A0A109UH02_9FIRM|nr:16S rRNA (guanine(966)-N(2))-methyltransferase RsmD [Erysipelothrix larvae]AMC93451.1 hypothetical protein AOC36_05485 [Erysipelothrix larvae]